MGSKKTYNMIQQYNIYSRHSLMKSNHYYYWLKPETEATILGAFGQTDGMVVIKATNAYLNHLVASDRDKATALAGFINIEPMVVCSLNLQPNGVIMPIRWLQGDGTAYIDTGHYATSAMKIKTKVKTVVQGAYGRMFGSRTSSATSDEFAVATYPNEPKHYYFGLGGATTDNVPGGAPTIQSTANIYDIYGDITKFIVNNFTWNSGKTTLQRAPHAFWLFSYQAPTAVFAGGMSFADLEDTNYDACFIPWELKTARTASECYPNKTCAVGTKGMMDVYSGIFHPNANTSGLFGLNYCLPDGTPWTPSTP